MPQGQPVWELMKDAEQMVRDLVAMYPEKFGHVDADMVGCAAVTGKDKPPTQEWQAKISGLREPEALWSKKIYCIQFYKTTWESLGVEHRQHMIFKQLERIGDDCDGKVLPEDLKDSYCLVKAYGPDYMRQTTLPNLLTEKKNFVQSLHEKNAEENSPAPAEVKEKPQE